MIKALLCDIDGTLIHSNWLHAAAWKDALAAIGVETDVETVRRQIGKGADTLLPTFVPWWRRPIVEEPLKAYRKFVFDHDYRDQIECLPGVRDFMLRLQAAGVRISLASSAHTEELAIFKRIAQIEDMVEVESSSDDAEKSKPHPDIFEATLRKLGLDADDVLALGDTPWDAEAAGKAGIGTIGVTTGGWSHAELLAAGCVAVYTDVAELLAGFEDSPIVRF